MVEKKQTIFWIVITCILFLAIYSLSPVLMPFVAGMILAYLLDPLVDRVEKIGIRRSLSTFFVLTIFFVCSVGSSLLLLPVILNQLSNLTSFLPTLISNLEPFIRQARSLVDNAIKADNNNQLPLPVADILNWAGGFLTEIISSSLAFANLLSLIIITPIVAFYLLRDWDLIIKKVKSWMPIAQKVRIVEQVSKVDRSLSALVRGQGTVCLILALYYSVSLTAVGLQFGILIGIFSGIVSFIPFVGAILGAIFSIGFSIIQFDTYTPIFFVAGIFLVGQVVEGNFLTPKLIGEAVGLHPVWVIFALLTGATLFGFLGVLLALPIAVVVAVLIRFSLSSYLGSEIYSGEGDVDRRD
jgi:predicted PurR-regulated permease PerM